MEDIQILLWGIAGSLITTIGAYFILLRPMYIKALNRRDEAEAIERRMQHEAEVACSMRPR
jgi:hypothetical protein